MVTASRPTATSRDRIVLGLDLDQVESDQALLPPIHVQFAAGARSRAAADHSSRPSPTLPSRIESEHGGRRARPRSAFRGSTVRRAAIPPRSGSGPGHAGASPCRPGTRSRKTSPPAFTSGDRRGSSGTSSASGHRPRALAVPWSVSTRTMWAESAAGTASSRRASFWVQTRSIRCNCITACGPLRRCCWRSPGSTRGAIAEPDARASPATTGRPSPGRAASNYAFRPQAVQDALGAEASRATAGPRARPRPGGAMAAASGGSLPRPVHDPGSPTASSSPWAATTSSPTIYEKPATPPMRPRRPRPQ